MSSQFSNNALWGFWSLWEPLKASPVEHNVRPLIKDLRIVVFHTTDCCASAGESPAPPGPQMMRSSVWHRWRRKITGQGGWPTGSLAAREQCFLSSSGGDGSKSLRSNSQRRLESKWVGRPFSVSSGDPRIWGNFYATISIKVAVRLSFVNMFLYM